MTSAMTSHPSRDTDADTTDAAATLTLTLNGEPAMLCGVATIMDLLTHLGYQGKRVAVECNGQIVPRGLHAQTFLRDGDQLEIVVAVGGG